MVTCIKTPLGYKRHVVESPYAAESDAVEGTKDVDWPEIVTVQFLVSEAGD